MQYCESVAVSILRAPPLREAAFVGSKSARRTAMTLIEMTIVVFVLGAGLFLLAGWMSNVRQEARRDLAIRMLADLDRALSRYHRSTGAYPASKGLRPAATAVQATADLVEHERTRPILDALPTLLWQGLDKRTLTDPWGTPLRYYPTTSDSPLVKANNGRPVFVSAGPDRLFGDVNPSGLGDDLRSDDPGSEGFRLEHALREAVIEPEKEQSHGEEND